MTFRVFPAAAIALAAAACATYEPLPYGQVVTMKRGEAQSVDGFPPPGTTWRLDAADLNAVSPAPIVDGPPPPRVWYPPPPPGPYGVPY